MLEFLDEVAAWVILVASISTSILLVGVVVARVKWVRNFFTFLLAEAMERGLMPLHEKVDKAQKTADEALQRVKKVEDRIETKKHKIEIIEKSNEKQYQSIMREIDTIISLLKGGE